MTSDALRKSIFWRDPEARIRLAFTVPEAALLYGMACSFTDLLRQLGHDSATSADELGVTGDAGKVLTRVTGKLYTGLFESCGRGL